MPKYYRFRATTPTRNGRNSRKAGQISEKDTKKEVLKTVKVEKLFEDLLGLMLCPAMPSWYLRRTAWRRRENPTLAGPTLQLAGPIRQLTQDVSRYL